MSNPVPSLPGQAAAPRYLSAAERLNKLPSEELAPIHLAAIQQEPPQQPRFTVVLAYPDWLGGKVITPAIIADTAELAAQIAREETHASLPRVCVRTDEFKVLAVFRGEHRSLI